MIDFNKGDDMRRISGTGGVAAAVIVLLVCGACAPGLRLEAHEAQRIDVEGTYTVILFGCGFLNDFETAAFLDREGDRFTFEPYASDFRYKVREGVGAEDALAEAARFLDCNTAFRDVRLRQISGPGGEIMGYEMLPVYYSFTYGAGETLLTDYRLKDDKVVVRLRLAPWVENMLSDGGGRKQD
jgi:hypothetical protein